MGGDRDGEADPARGGGTAPLPAVVAAVGATLLVVLLATWAASIGPGDVLRGEGLSRIGDPDGPTPSSTEVDPTDGRGDSREREPGGTPGWLVVLAVLAQAATVAVVLYLAHRALRWMGRLRLERRTRPERAADLDFEVLDATEHVVEAIVSDAGEQRAALLEGAPRNAIVACWHRFEIQASSAGLAREPWETSSEFTLRLFDLVSAEPRAVGELAALYREARFSDHELGEEARVRAVAALDSLHRQLSRRVRRTGAAR
ncbi:MAG: DUF4129 domain-containing protein [Actinomycetota bacterium]|nr:DUF4129 domain-containing protein [Actinomycetota bacterium]